MYAVFEFFSACYPPVLVHRECLQVSDEVFYNALIAIYTKINTSAMHLYVIAGHINIDISDITLVDGFRPSVGGYRPSTIDFEPAVWFKVMVFDAVTIDCDEHRVSWVSLGDSTVSDFAALDSGIARCASYLLGSSAGDNQHHFIDCSDDALNGQLREVFDDIRDLLTCYESNQVTREDFNIQLMQLLHVHVLPSIRLTVHDADCIVTCINNLEVIIDQIDKDILEVAEKISRAEKSLAGLRKKILDELMSDDRKSNSSSMFSHEFIDLLLSKSGIGKDIESAWAAVEHAQVTVERLKENPEATDAEIRTERAERDFVIGEYEKILITREKLKEMSRSKRGIVKRVRDAFATGCEDPQHKIYVGIISKLAEFEKLNKIITQKKLLVTSVKEAARLALNDLRSGSESFGVDVDSVGAAHSTDVLGGNIRAPWQSLAEQIASILSNHSHQIAKLHQGFCRHISDVCSATAMEKRLYDESLQALQCLGQSSKTSHSMTHSSSSGNISEFEVDLSSTAFCPSDCASLPGEQCCQSRESTELSQPGVSSKQESLAKSLPQLQSAPVTSTSGALSMRSMSISNPQKVNPRPDVRPNLRSVRKAKSSTLMPSFTSYVPRGLISLSHVDSGQDSPVIVVDTGRDCVRVALDSVRKEIMDHFDKISTQLQHELSASSGKSQYQQIWLDYESHFYQELMAPLTALYQLQYANITDALCSSLLELTPHDLRLDEAVLVHLLQEHHEQFPSMCSFDSYISTDSESKDSHKAKSAATLSKCEDLPGTPESFGMVTEGQVLVDDNGERDDLSRLLRSHSEESQLPRLRTVRISLPVIGVPRSPTSVLVYERTLAPLPSERDLLQSNTELSLSATTMMLKPCYRQQFASALKHIESAIEARTPASKLRHLTDCLRETTKQLAAFYGELYGPSSSQSSCDELLDAVVILLCNIDGHQMALLYSQLTLLADLMAPWLERGPYSFTLVQFTGACQFIQERLMLKRNRHMSK